MKNLLIAVGMFFSVAGGYLTYDAVRYELWAHRVHRLTWEVIRERIRQNCPDVLVLKSGKEVCPLVIFDPESSSVPALPVIETPPPAPPVKAAQPRARGR